MIETTEAVLVMDRFQNTDQARVCQRDFKHGKLWVHKSGSFLLCQLCEYKEPISKDLLEEAVKIDNQDVFFSPIQDLR